MSESTNMHVGTCKIKLFLPMNLNLKGKRRIVKSLSEQIRSRFNVSVSEIENNELWKIATIGIAIISNKIIVLNQTFDQIFSFIESSNHDLNIISHDIEIIS
ncbi:uncharacterized protein METZ01_LOCUS288010 [marine metagenome]|uniref:DUF503 domain-containing protein n=1 Tax=marine metagenome TaxID=408172 RepID=A0A382LET4_9ZZZZ